jgi:hypothetical protein
MIVQKYAEAAASIRLFCALVAKSKQFASIFDTSTVTKLPI